MDTICGTRRSGPSGGGAAQGNEEFQGFIGGNPAYTLALENLDGDMPQYITDNTDDELSHAAFLKAFLKSKGRAARPGSISTLPSSQATGARQIKRLTNLMKLNVDLSWYTRYRSGKNPDFGAAFKGPFVITNQPAIPLNDTDTPPPPIQRFPSQAVMPSDSKRSPTLPDFTLLSSSRGGEPLSDPGFQGNRPNRPADPGQYWRSRD